MANIVAVNLPCANYTPYSPVMSCCKNELDHKSHMAHQAIMQYMERSNYILIPPVSTGYGSTRMSLSAALKYLKEKLG